MDLNRKYETDLSVLFRISDISAGQCMFRRYVFFTAKIWIDQKVETEKSCTEKKEHRRKIALQRVVKEPPVFSRKMLCHKKNLIIY